MLFLIIYLVGWIVTGVLISGAFYASEKEMNEHAHYSDSLESEIVSAGFGFVLGCVWPITAIFYIAFRVQEARRAD